MAAVEFVGPFKSWDVLVDGYRVPFLRATPLDDEGAVHLNLDRRFGIDLSRDEALKVVPFLADAIAIALGHTCHPSPDLPRPPKRPFAPAMHSLVDSPAGAALIEQASEEEPDDPRSQCP